MSTIETGRYDDEDPVTIEYMRDVGGPIVAVNVWVGDDGTTVVQVDTVRETGRLRINLNDSPVWDGNPDTDEAPGANFGDSAAEDDPSERECQGHESLAGEHMGESVFCGGECRGL